MPSGFLRDSPAGRHRTRICEMTSSVSGTLFPHLPQAGVSIGEETAGWLRHVNRPAETPMKMLYPCLAHDPSKCWRFGDQILRSPEFGARSDAKPISTFADRAPGGAAGRGI